MYSLHSSRRIIASRLRSHSAEHIPYALITAGCADWEIYRRYREVL